MRREALLPHLETDPLRQLHSAPSVVQPNRQSRPMALPCLLSCGRGEMSVQHDDLVRLIRLYISEIGGMSVKIDTPGLLYDRNGRPVKLGRKGALDIAAVVRGRAVWIDAKIGRDTLKPDQRKFAHAVQRAGGIAFAARSVENVADALRSEGLIDA